MPLSLNLNLKTFKNFLNLFLKCVVSELYMFYFCAVLLNC